MLFNKTGDQVVIPRKFNSETNPNMFKHLREKLWPETHKGHKMFRMEERARICA